MTALDLAKKYMKSFSGVQPLEEMKSVLADDLKFTGSFYIYDTAEEYIESLKECPTVEISYEILKEIGNETSCCIVYKVTTEEKEEIMAQLFQVQDDKITRIRLILEGSKFLDN